jgi:hypothetical protein
MKKLLFLVAFTVVMSGCAGAELMGSQFVGSTAGINRRITLYSATGNVIRTYEGRFAIDSEGGEVDFIVDGKRITLNGTYIVEEF